jgi:hypothetical protein
MKKTIASMMVLFASAAAHADGFVCQTVEGDLNVKAYNNTQPEAGTRNAAVLVLSDPAINSGRKTIARFTDVNGTVGNTGASYTANVDLRFNDSGRKGELISGTKLGELKTIDLEVAFSYARPVAADETLQGKLTLTKRNGEVIERDLDCTRYLKN